MTQQDLSKFDSELLYRFRKKARYLTIAVIFLAMLALLGWQFDIEFLKRPFPRLVAMNPVSAICFLLTGISLLLINSPKKKQSAIVIAYSLAAIPLFLCLYTLSGYLWNFYFQFDTLLFNEKLKIDGAGNLSNRMAPNTAFNFVLLGLAIILIGKNKRAHKNLANYLSLIILLGALFAIIGYLYKVKEFYGLLSFLPMAFHTALGFILIGLAVMFFNAQAGFMSIISHSNSGGVIARLLIPATIFVPIIMGYIRLLIQWQFPISVELGVDFLITTIILLFFVLVLYISLVINKKDNLRKEAEQLLYTANAKLEQKVIERTKELNMSEKRFRALIENGNDLITLVDKNAKVLYVSPAIQKIMGFTSEEVMGKDGLIMVHPDHIEESKKIINEILQEPGVPKARINRFLHKQGHYIWMEGTTTNLLEDENVHAIVSNYRDITERKETEEKIKKLNEELERKVTERTTELEKNIRQLKESEEKFQKAFHAGAAGITITRLSDSTYLEVNDAFVQMTECSRKELLGHTSTDYGMVFDFDKREEVLRQVREHGSARNFEMTVRSKSGKILKILSSIETVLINNEKCAINIIYDITERKRSEEKLEYLNKELEAFSYSVSHDLRAPLRSIHGYSHILKEEYGDKLDKEGQKKLDSIMVNAKMMGQLIDDLLNFSKLGRSEIKTHTVDMNEIVKGVLEELKQSGTIIPAQLKISELESAQCDGSLIKQVWTNLLSNAIKYSSIRKNPVIDVGIKKESDRIIYYIKDDGAGFDMKYYNKLFGVFQRLHKHEEFFGTGVGLAIVHRIVTRHGGSIWAEGKVNEGATFYFSLTE